MNPALTAEDTQARLARTGGPASLVLVHKAIVGVVSGELNAYETLLRWPADEVIPEGSIVASAPPELGPALDEHILAKTLVSVRALSRVCPRLPVHVRLSTKALDDGYVGQARQRVLDIAALAPIVIDVPGALLDTNLPNASRFIQDMHDLGVGSNLVDLCAISRPLRVLEDLRFKAVKLDACLVASAAESAQGLRTLRGLVSMFRQLGFDTIAVGAVTAQHIETVRQARCDCYENTRLLGLDAMLVQALAAQTVNPPNPFSI